MIGRVRISLLLAAMILATAPVGTSSQAAAAGDAPNRCSQATVASPIGSWISGTIDSATDVDWYRVALPDRELVQFVLGDLPANYRMEVYDHCGADRSWHDYRPGTEFEELLLQTNFEPYKPSYVRVSGVSGASSSDPYKLRLRVVQGKLSILSRDSFVDASGRHIVGEVLARSSYRRVRVTATLFDSSGGVLGTHSVRTKLREIEWSRYRQRTPFEIVFPQPPGFDHYRLSVTGTQIAVDPVARLQVTALSPTVDGLGVTHFPGEVRNNNSFVIESLDVFVTVYDSLGRVINVAEAATNKESVAAGGKATFDASFESHVATWNRWAAVAQALAAP